MTKEDVLNVAKLILKFCDGAVSKDKRGYDLFDAVTVRQFLYPSIDGYGIEDLEPEEIEYLRRKLLRYRKQLRKIALLYGIPSQNIDNAIRRIEEPVSENWLIIHGQIKHGEPYGRMSLKWVREHLISKVKQP